jgi:hypothetical protein
MAQSATTNTRTARGRDPEPVVQFSLFMPNRLGRLCEIIRFLGEKEVHVLALTVLDTTDSTILRLIVDDPDSARTIFQESQQPFSETTPLVVELDYERPLQGALEALLEAELNIHYIYPFLTRQSGKSALAISIEHPDVAELALRRHQFTVLYQGDLSR